MKRWAWVITIVGAAGMLAACGGRSSTPEAATPVRIVRQLATLGPTHTPDPNALLTVPTSTPTITPEPSPTPYVGVFLGEAQPSGDVSAFAPQGPGASLAGGPTDLQALLCLVQPDVVFGTGWMTTPRALNNLRCPIQESFGFNGEVQIFERGVMYVNNETGEVWAISPGGLTSIGQFWYLSQLPLIALDESGVPFGIDAPAGLIVPRGALGAVWAGLPQVREALGYAITVQREAPLNVQRFEGGTLLLDVTVGQVFALLVNGDAFGPF